MNGSRSKTSPTASSRLALVVAVVLTTVILVLQKPWALFTPQLWAEDGTIHLTDTQLFGIDAIWRPYRGYLHVVPRLIALAASHTVDPAYWPLFYNAACLTFTAVLLARIASPRLELPNKPWLILAFALMAHTGEPYLNITNLHWLMDLFLVQQALMASPKNHGQRIGDYLVILCAGLSDPSALIFFPLFAWRWWRERRWDNAIPLLLVIACAAVQGWFLRAGNLSTDGQPNPLILTKLLEVAASRLVIWPFLGIRAVTAIPGPAQAIIGVVVVLAVIGWALRPSPRRTLRAWVIAAWLLVTFACVYRIRPDQWTVELANLGFAEPYFLASRLLFVWLVIWEFDAAPRAVGWLARGACATGALLQLPHSREPTPPNYHWAEHCAPIRQGVPANIPTLPEGWILEYRGRPQHR